MNSVTGDDLACTDEIKVYEDEGEEDEQVKSSENLTEDKVGLVIESEEQVFSFSYSFLAFHFFILIMTMKFINCLWLKTWGDILNLI